MKSWVDAGSIDFKWLLWDFSGIRFIYRKIYPLSSQQESSSSYRKPSTFFLWLITLYIATFSIASQRFENRLDKAEQKSNILVAQLSGKGRKGAYGRIASVQRTSCPIEPKFFKIQTPFASLLLKDVRCESVVQNLLNVVESERSDLAGVDLSGADLREAELREANLSKANLVSATLWKADLTEANLDGANLDGSQLYRADLARADLTETALAGAVLREATLREAILNEANLSFAFLFGANLDRADLTDAKLTGTFLNDVKGLTFAQLSKVKTLYGVQGLDKELEAELKKKHPELFKKPSIPFSEEVLD